MAIHLTSEPISQLYCTRYGAEKYLSGQMLVCHLRTAAGATFGAVPSGVLPRWFEERLALLHLLPRDAEIARLGRVTGSGNFYLYLTHSEAEQIEQHIRPKRRGL